MAEYLAESAKNGEVFLWFRGTICPTPGQPDADHLAWIASSRAPIPPDVIIDKLTKPSVKAVEMLRETNLMIIDGAKQQPEIDWMSPIKC
jgi:hypothetical protein